MADTEPGANRGSTKREQVSIGETVQLAKDYVIQEVKGPLNNAKRWIIFGGLGAFLLGSATLFITLGVLRLLQTEMAPTFRGRWMHLVPYAVALAVALLAIIFAVTRISKRPLEEPSKEHR